MVKKIWKTLWDILVFVAYLKFYIFCLITGSIVFLLVIVVLSQHGGDPEAIESIGNAIPILMYIMVFFVGVIMIDKFFKIIYTQKNGGSM